MPRLEPPTPLRGSVPLRDRWFAVGARAPWSCCSQQRVLLTMKTGFSFARYFSFTCSADMYVSVFTGCVHPHEVKVFIAASDSGQQSASLSGLWDTLPLQFASGLQHHCVVCAAA